MDSRAESDTSYLGPIRCLFGRDVEVIGRVEVSSVDVVVVALQVLNELCVGVDVVGALIVEVLL